MRWTKKALKPLLLALFALFGAGAGWAIADSVASISQGYHSSASLAQGSLVSISKDNAKEVQLTTSDNLDHLVGVVTEANQTLLSLSSQDTNVQVATGGVALTLVSDVNGDIRPGDRITVSPITGVGMRATSSAEVVGTAQADFNAKSADVKQVELTTKSGKKQTAVVGRMPVLIDVGFYETTAAQDSIFPSSIQKVFDNLANRHVSTFRIIVALIILVIALVIVTVLIYGATRSSIISIGRNPLSQPAIRRSLFQVIIIAAGILLVTLISIYLVISR